MTTPTQMDCSHQGNGWCLDCVGKLADDRDRMLRELEKVVENCDRCHDGNIIGDEWPNEIPCPKCSGAQSVVVLEV